jgi:mono/diheme cytochrome c family protein
MKIKQHLLLAFIMVAMLAGTYSCQQAGGNKTGSELIPDMAHSTAYEANVLTNYSLNSWDEQSTFSRRELSQPRQPVNGTVPRGFAGIASNDGVFPNADAAVLATLGKMKPPGGIAYTPNGATPYYYPDTEDGRTLATQKILYNPFPITKDGIARGQELYNIYCGICHGDIGDGGGYLVRDNGGKYPAQPANFLDSLLVFSSNGRYYHSIMYGKNAMGAYADKLSYEERWQVIHYIRLLQAQARKVKYNDEVNELKAEFGVPAARAKQLAAANLPPQTELPPAEQPGRQDAQNGGDHSHGGGGGN